jgi:hypothetical protein
MLKPKEKSCGKNIVFYFEVGGTGRYYVWPCLVNLKMYKTEKLRFW